MTTADKSGGWGRTGALKRREANEVMEDLFSRWFFELGRGGSGSGLDSGSGVGGRGSPEVPTSAGGAVGAASTSAYEGRAYCRTRRGSVRQDLAKGTLRTMQRDSWSRDLHTGMMLPRAVAHNLGMVVPASEGVVSVWTNEIKFFGGCLLLTRARLACIDPIWLRLHQAQLPVGKIWRSPMDGRCSLR